MSVPEGIDLRAPLLAVADLVHLDTTGGPVRLLVGDDALFRDVGGTLWYGSRLIDCSEVETSIGGTAPAAQLTFSFVQDPDQEDLLAAIREYGVASVRGRKATFYLQYFQSIGQIFKPVFAPQRWATRTMVNLDYHFEGPQVRRVSLTVEGPFNLRSVPVGGRYNTSDHSRRCGYANPSLEYMPTNAFDEQPLFGG